ncbi:neural proliferation differentiation and control protein 1 isoform X1 [Acipenser oxyrinchus oxyrinchus]|uniref:Neural proliferation differentiation and control protein 1 isoform X1 n=1 Tax=Acipenser oxyrinchus oxyrinchus TaxID=40147 RepID=A0AAD8FSE2_ACIOX|nr:neural proliferation differentiation and control protein 1 isoform X1 [Acipenser oxyrinchus oxyrinchus]
MTDRRRGVLCWLSAAVLPGAVLCAFLMTVHGSLPVDSCPRSLDCTMQRRQFCQPGSRECGPCISPLVEDEHKNCVVMKRSLDAGKMSTVPSVDEEIDYLASIIAKQRHQQVELKQEDNPPTVIGNALETSRKEEIPVQMNADVQSATGEAKASQSPTTAANTPTKPAVRHGPVTSPYPGNDALLLTMIVVCTVVGTAALIVAGVCWVRLQKEMRLAQKVDYPAFRVMGPTTFEGTLPGDKKLAQSAQMYHYQHQKQQMLSLEKHKEEPKEPGSGATSDEENEDGDFTVYECPGLAPTGEMEVKNPLFDDSSLHPQKNHQ